MGGEQLGAERADAVQVFERAQSVPYEGAFDAGQALVDVDLHGRAGFLGEPCGAVQGRRGGRLGDRDGEGGVDQRIAVVPGEVLLGAFEDGGGGGVLGGGRGVAGDVVAHEAEYAADSGVTGGRRDDVDVHIGARTGVGDGGEAAAQGLQRRQFGRGMGRFLVQRPFQRNPDPAEDLRRLTEGERGAEALGQVVVGVDEARHQEVAGQHYGVESRVRTCHFRGRSDGAEGAVGDDDRVAVDGPFRQQHGIGYEEERAG